MGKDNETYLSFGTRALRTTVAGVGSLVLRSEVEKPVSRGWRRAEDLSEGGSGIIVAHPHFSMGDPLQVIKRVFESPVLRKREVFVPQTLRHYTRLYGPLGRPISVKVFPVATPEDAQRARANEELHQKLLRKYKVDVLDTRSAVPLFQTYAREAVTLLERGAVEIVAPQATREGKLITVTDAVGIVLRRALRRNVHNIGVLFVGLGIDGVTDYGQKSVSGINAFRSHRYQDGRCLTLDEIANEVGGDLEAANLGAFVRQEMEKTVPPEYLDR